MGKNLLFKIDICYKNRRDKFSFEDFYFRYQILLPSGRFITNPVEAEENSWFHVVFNFIGSENGQGFISYHNGVNVLSDNSKDLNRWLPGDRKIVIGRLYTDDNEGYSSVHLDEFLIFNQALTEAQINRLNLWTANLGLVLKNEDKIR